MLDSTHSIRICHFTSSHRALDTRIFNREAISLRKAGYDVVIVGQHPKQDVIEGVQIVPLVGKSVNRLLLLIQILELALKQHAAVYHFHDPDLIVVGLILKLLRKKVIYDVHEDYKQIIRSRGYFPSPLRKILSNLFAGFEQFASKNFDYMVVVDSNIQSKFRTSKTELITNFPPASAFSQEVRNQSLNGQFLVVFLGALGKLRGAVPMIDALSLLRHKSNVELHIIGNVAEPELVALLAGNQRVVCHGRVPLEQTYQMLADADVGLLLYQGTPAYMHITWEGCTKLFEYMGSGLPIIYSDFPKLRKLLEPIGCGIPVDPTSPQEIADAIDRLYENSELRAILGARGRLAVQEQYNWENEEQKLFKVYERVLILEESKNPHECGICS